MTVSALVDPDDLVVRRKVITLVCVGTVKEIQSAVQEKNRGAVTDGLDVKAGAVDGIIFVGPDIALRESRDANESTRCDENDGYQVIPVIEHDEESTIFSPRYPPRSRSMLRHLPLRIYARFAQRTTKSLPRASLPECSRCYVRRECYIRRDARQSAHDQPVQEQPNHESAVPIHEQRHLEHDRQYSHHPKD